MEFIPPPVLHSLTDALGSMRQMTTTTAKSYDPYGVVRTNTQSINAQFTSYGFTGEQTDPSGLLYLRARHYSPTLGRFMTRDTWDGDSNRPLSFNRWNYVFANPVNATDPTGNVPCESIPPSEW